MDWLTPAISIGSSLLGMNKKKSKGQKLQEDALRRQNDLTSRITRMAEGYDPAAETRQAVDFGQRTASNALVNAQGSLNQRFKTAGGSPTGDTNFALLAQRGQDDILNPLAGWAAERSASNFQRRLQAFQAALGPNQSLFGMGGAMPEQDNSAQMQLLMQGVQGLMPQPKAQQAAPKAKKAPKKNAKW